MLTVAVRTGDRDGAGTESGVYLQVMDARGEKRTWHLPNQSANQQQRFQRGQTDHFQIYQQEPIGEPNEVRIWKSEANSRGWHLDAVDVLDAQFSTLYHFPCNSWLSKTKDDGEICQHLRCQAKTSPIANVADEQEEAIRAQVEPVVAMYHPYYGGYSGYGAYGMGGMRPYGYYGARYPGYGYGYGGYGMGMGMGMGMGGMMMGRRMGSWSWSWS